MHDVCNKSHMSISTLCADASSRQGRRAPFSCNTVCQIAQQLVWHANIHMQEVVAIRGDVKQVHPMGRCLYNAM
jgi:hypothetical protein